MKKRFNRSVDYKFEHINSHHDYESFALNDLSILTERHKRLIDKHDRKRAHQRLVEMFKMDFSDGDED